MKGTAPKGCAKLHGDISIAGSLSFPAYVFDGQVMSAFPFPSASSPAKRVEAESEEIPTRAQFSAKPETERWWEFLSCLVLTKKMHLSRSASASETLQVRCTKCVYLQAKALEGVFKLKIDKGRKSSKIGV